MSESGVARQVRVIAVRAFLRSAKIYLRTCLFRIILTHIILHFHTVKCFQHATAEFGGSHALLPKLYISGLPRPRDRTQQSFSVACRAIIAAGSCCKPLCLLQSISPADCTLGRSPGVVIHEPQMDIPDRAKKNKEPAVRAVKKLHLLTWSRISFLERMAESHGVICIPAPASEW